MIDVKIIQKDFPILSRKIHGKSLTYLDNGATSQKPQEVIDALVDFYTNHNANIHRGIHTLGDEATELYRQSREVIADFIGANDSNELVFVRNTTEAINLVAYSWGRANISSGDVILMSEMEHHSNIVPWQVLADEVGAKIEYISVGVDGLLDQDDFEEKLKLKPKLLSIVQVSNFLGTINPVSQMAKKARLVGAKILVDGAQSTPHMRIDVRELGVDFFTFSGHKMLGPMGIGGLWVRSEILSDMPPFMHGGGMISEVHLAESLWADLPDRFDAGTPNVAGAIGLMAAVKYLKNLGMDAVRAHGEEVLGYAMDRLSSVAGLKLYGPDDVSVRGGVVAFTLDGIHAHDVAQILDREVSVAVRSGHHCTMPMHKKLEIPATTRASFYIYNDKNDVDVLIDGIEKVKSIFGEK